MTKVPLVIYEHGERIVIGTCDTKRTEQGGWEVSGVIEHDRYKDLLQSKNNPDYYSVFYDHEDFKVIETAYSPPPSIPLGRAQFTGLIPDPTQQKRIVMTIEYQDFVRKPFVVKAVEITEDNIQAIADELGKLKYDEDTGVPYIAVEKGRVPNVARAQLGWFVTRHGKRTHCYAPKIFDEQFVENDEQIQLWVDSLNEQYDDEVDDADAQLETTG